MLATTLHNQVLSKPPTVYHRKQVTFPVISATYLKANKVSKSERTRKVEFAYHFESMLMLVDKKLSKFVHACRNYSLLESAHFLRHRV